jgi:hypothetical protein
MLNVARFLNNYVKLAFALAERNKGLENEGFKAFLR